MYWDYKCMPREQIYLWFNFFFRNLAVDDVSPLMEGDMELREI